MRSLSSLFQKNEGMLKNAGASAYIEKSALDLDKNADFLIQVIETAAC
jgi:hypothetical protein